MCIMVVLSVWVLFRLINWFPACEFSRWCSVVGMWWSLVVCGVYTRMFAPKQVRHIYRISQSIFASKNITFLLAFSSHCVRLFLPSYVPKYFVYDYPIMSVHCSSRFYVSFDTKSTDSYTRLQIIFAGFSLWNSFSSFLFLIHYDFFSLHGGKIIRDWSTPPRSQFWKSIENS